MDNSGSTLSVTEAAQLLRASYPRTMRALLTGEINGEKVDGRWRISRASVEAAGGDWRVNTKVSARSAPSTAAPRPRSKAVRAAIGSTHVPGVLDSAAQAPASRAVVLDRIRAELEAGA